MVIGEVMRASLIIVCALFLGVSVHAEVKGMSYAPCFEGKVMQRPSFERLAPEAFIGEKPRFEKPLRDTGEMYRPELEKPQIEKPAFEKPSFSGCEAPKKPRARATLEKIDVTAGLPREGRSNVARAGTPARLKFGALPPPRPLCVCPTSAPRNSMGSGTAIVFAK
jgi:hypothetical protein